MAGAQEVRLGAGFQPHLATEAAVSLFGVSNYRASERNRRFNDLYAKAEIATALHLAEGFSVQAVIKFEPFAGGPDRGQDRAFQDQGAFIESLFAEWQPIERVTFQAGKFTAPFGYGPEGFPGIRLRDWSESYEISESLGFGVAVTVIDDAEGVGAHTLSAAIFTLDTTSLSSSAITRKRFGRDEAERFSRNSRGQGGPGNTGRLNSWALALDGDQMAWLPGFTYHAAILSRGAGRDGTAREWGYAIGAQQTITWNEEWRTLLFAEAVQFRNSGGRPRTAITTIMPDPVTGDPVESIEDAVIGERRTITTLGARTSHGPWRSTLAWQTDRRARTVSSVPRESYTEFTVGRELAFGFTVDVGVSRTRYGRDEGSPGTVDAALGLLSWRASF